MLRPAIFIILLGISLLYFFSRQEEPEEQATNVNEQPPDDLIEASEELNPEGAETAGQNQKTIEVITGQKK